MISIRHLAFHVTSESDAPTCGFYWFRGVENASAYNARERSDDAISAFIVSLDVCLSNSVTHRLLSLCLSVYSLASSVKT